MQSEISNLIARIEEQTAQFHQMENALRACGSAYKLQNIELIYIHLDKQARLCERIRELQQETGRAALAAFSNPANGVSGSDDREPQLEKALNDLAAAQRNVRRMNAEQWTFAMGTLRTLRVMNNALSNCYPIYTQANGAFFGGRP